MTIGKTVILDLDKIHGNPWRNFEIYPLEKDQIEKLTHSIGQHGFLGGIKARPIKGKKGHVELSCGHHRIAACRAYANLHPEFKTIELVVGPMSDDEMIRLMARENGTQNKTTPAAIQNDLYAVTKRLAEVLLSSANFSTIVEKSRAISKAFTNEKSYDSARGRIQSGEGLGEPIISAYLGEGNPDDCHWGLRIIREGLWTLKATGKLTEIVTEVHNKTEKSVLNDLDKKYQDLEAEQKKYSIIGDRAKAEAARKKKRNLDARIEAFKNAPRVNAEKNPIEFDAKCTTLFPNANQLSAFRGAMNTTAAERLIPLDKQFPFAKDMMKVLGGNTLDPKRVSESSIREWVSCCVRKGIKSQKDIDKEEAARLITDQETETLQGLLTNAHKYLRSLAGICFKIQLLISRNSRLKENDGLKSFVRQADSFRSMLNKLIKEVFGMEYESDKSRRERAERTKTIISTAEEIEEVEEVH